jgi:CubicO group peptidase (beta-lactamase class C family)
LEDLEREVTIRDLLTHSSGLIHGHPHGTPVEQLVWNREAKEGILTAPNGEVAFHKYPDLLLAEWVSRLLDIPLAHQPGKGWSYGFSYDVLGHLVEVVSGMSLDAFFQERIFDPLGMADTHFHLPEEKIGRFSTLYCPAVGGGLQVVDRGSSSYWLVRKQYLSGGGHHGNALVSTVPDYYRFCQMMLNYGELDGVRLLSRKTVELMTMHNLPEGIHMDDSPGVGLGLGFWVMQDPGVSYIFASKGSFGGGGFAGAAFWMDPQEDLIGMMVTQNACWSWTALDRFPALVYRAIDD